MKNAISTTSKPSQNCQYAGWISEKKLCSSMNRQVPISAPYSRPVPPSTSMIKAPAERSKLSTSRPTNCVVCAVSAPATPASAADNVKMAVSLRRTGTPMAGMRRSFSRIPISDRPKGEATIRRARTKARNNDTAA
jgi:hypothetical protein